MRGYKHPEDRTRPEISFENFQRIFPFPEKFRLGQETKACGKKKSKNSSVWQEKSKRWHARCQKNQIEKQSVKLNRGERLEREKEKNRGEKNSHSKSPVDKAVLYPGRKTEKRQGHPEGSGKNRVHRLGRHQRSSQGLSAFAKRIA